MVEALGEHRRHSPCPFVASHAGKRGTKYQPQVWWEVKFKDTGFCSQGMKMCFQMVAVVIESMEKIPSWWLCCLQKVLSLRKEWARCRMRWGIWPDDPQWINAQLWRSSSHWWTQQQNCTRQEVHKGQYWVQSTTKPPPPILVTILGFDFGKPEPPELFVRELSMVCMHRDESHHSSPAKLSNLSPQSLVQDEHAGQTESEWIPKRRNPSVFPLCCT